MPRRPRVEFEGARYHVLNRGNYRQDLFTVDRTGEAFLEKLYETCERYHWHLHAYVVMSNHYHLALETPLANLSAGRGGRGQGGSVDKNRRKVENERANRKGTGLVFKY